MPRQIRVLHIIDSLRGGGAERWLWDIIRKTGVEGFSHHVVTTHREDPSFVLAERLRATGAYRDASGRQRLADALPASGKRLLSSVLAHVDSAKPNLRGRTNIASAYVSFRPDVIHGHVFSGIGCGAWLKAWSHRPLVYSPWFVPSQLRDTEAAWVIDDLRRLHQAADVIITQPDSEHELLALGIPSNTLATFAGQVDLEAVDYTRADSGNRDNVRRSLQIPAGAPILLSVGRLTESKGHAFGLRALPDIVAHMPDVHWVLLGDGEDRSALEAAALRLGVAARTRIVGYVDNPLPFYAAADLYLRTHTREGENSSSQEAMAFGLPVVGFDTGCSTDRLQRVGHGVLVPTGDVPALAAAVVQLLKQPDRGRAVGDRGRQHAMRYLGLQYGIDLFKQIYRTLAHEPARPNGATDSRPWNSAAAA